MTYEGVDSSRAKMLRRALRLEWLTVGWNAVEGVIAVAAALAAGSVALLGFGIDSFVETVSGAVILWRIGAERRARDAERIERVEDIARRGVALSLWLLALYVAADATVALVSADRPSSSAVGMALLVLSIAVMKWLATSATASAVALARVHSQAMEADRAGRPTSAGSSRLSRSKGWLSIAVQGVTVTSIHAGSRPSVSENENHGP